MALGLGAMAFLALSPALSIIPALASREKKYTDGFGIIYVLAQTPKYARLAGYPLLALAGSFGIQQAAKMFK